MGAILPAASDACYDAGEWNEQSKIKLFAQSTTTGAVWKDFSSKFAGTCEICLGKCFLVDFHFFANVY